MISKLELIPWMNSLPFTIKPHSSKELHSSVVDSIAVAVVHWNCVVMLIFEMSCVLSHMYCVHLNAQKKNFNESKQNAKVLLLTAFYRKEKFLATEHQQAERIW